MNIAIAAAFLITSALLIVGTFILYDKKRKLSIACSIVGTLSLIGLFVSIWSAIINIWREAENDKT